MHRKRPQSFEPTSSNPEIIKTLKNPSFLNRLLRQTQQSQSIRLLKPKPKAKIRSSLTLLKPPSPNSLSTDHFFPRRLKKERERYIQLNQFYMPRQCKKELKGRTRVENDYKGLRVRKSGVGYQSQSQLKSWSESYSQQPTSKCVSQEKSYLSRDIMSQKGDVMLPCKKRVLLKNKKEKKQVGFRPRLSKRMKNWKSSLECLRKGMQRMTLKENSGKQKLNEIFYVKKRPRSVRRKMRDFNNNTVARLDLMDQETRDLFTLKQKRLRFTGVRKWGGNALKSSGSAPFIAANKCFLKDMKGKRRKKKIRQNFLSGTKFFKIKSRIILFGLKII